MRFRRAVRWGRTPVQPSSAPERANTVRRKLTILGGICLLACLAIAGLIGKGVSSYAVNVTPDLPRTSGNRPDWHGVPQHPDARQLRVLTADSSQFAVPAAASTVSGWFEREWTAAGLRYVETSDRDGTTFRIFAPPRPIFGYRLFGYAVAEADGEASTVTLIRVN